MEAITTEAAAIFASGLEPFASAIANTLGGHVYLVGSALKTLRPRDIDLRCVLTDRRFESRYGRSVSRWIEQGRTGNWAAVRWHWSRECVDLSKKLSEDTGLNVDFQVYPPGYLKGERLLLAEPATVESTPIAEDYLEQ